MSAPVSAPAARFTLAELRPAAVVAGWVAAILAGIELVQLLFSGLPWALLVGVQQAEQMAGDTGGLYDVTSPSAGDYVLSAGGQFVASLSFVVVPFAAGVLVSLWLLLPTPPGTTFVQLVLRGAVAALVGASLATLVRIIWIMPAGGYGSHDGVTIPLLGTVVLAATSLPVVLLVLVVRAYAPRPTRA